MHTNICYMISNKWMHWLNYIWLILTCSNSFDLDQFTETEVDTVHHCFARLCPTACRQLGEKRPVDHVDVSHMEEVEQAQALWSRRFSRPSSMPRACATVLPQAHEIAQVAALDKTLPISLSHSFTPSCFPWIQSSKGQQNPRLGIMLRSNAKCVKCVKEHFLSNVWPFSPSNKRRIKWSRIPSVKINVWVVAVSCFEICIYSRTSSKANKSPVLWEHADEVTFPAIMPANARALAMEISGLGRQWSQPTQTVCATKLFDKKNMFWTVMAHVGKFMYSSTFASKTHYCESFVTLKICNIS